MTPEDVSSTFHVHAQPMDDLHRLAPAEVKVLGFYDISGAHFQSPARRAIVIKVPREDEEWVCSSGQRDDWNEGYRTVLRCCK